ncbi:hypothetical protein AMJ86_03930 [bacterium SM23_57]|nr:MAG: hypothetical protein AMJ86_03930 [bacterium SM23_57]
MDTLTQPKIIVTGGDGFLGTYVVKLLQDQGVRNVFVPRSKHYDLYELENVHRLFRDYPPDLVIHLASSCPLSQESNNHNDPYNQPDMCMCKNILAAAQQHTVPEVVTVLDYHSYPGWCDHPLSEDDLEDLSNWNAKDAGNLLGATYLKEVVEKNHTLGEKSNIITCITSEIYGPGDRFQVQSRRLLAAAIRIISDAKEQQDSEAIIPGHPDDEIDFLYITEAVDGIVAAIKSDVTSGIINLALGKTHRWRNVVEQVVAYLEYDGEMSWMETDRQPRQVAFNVSRAKDRTGFNPSIGVEVGLQETVQWFCTHRRFILENEADTMVQWQTSHHNQQITDAVFVK